MIVLRLRIRGRHQDVRSSKPRVVLGSDPRADVVCTDVGGIPQLIENGKQGLLVTPGSVEELAEALLTVTAGPEVRERIAAGSRERIREYDTSRKVQEILSIYREVTRCAP